MKKCVTLSLFLLLLQTFTTHSLTFSQGIYKPGAIVTNKNDTIKGWIADLAGRKMTTLCIFKESEHEKSKKYSPSDLKAYYFFSGKHYITHTISSNNVTNKAFLELLLDGKADLFTINGNKFYIQDERDSLHELINSDMVREQNGTTYLTKKKEYVGILTTIFSNYPEMKSFINETEFNSPQLIKLTEQYHIKACNNNNCIKYEKDRRTRVSIGITSSFFSSNVSFSDYVLNYNFLSKEKFTPQNFIKFGPTLTLNNFLIFNQNLSLNINLEYQKSTYKSEYITLNLPNMRIPIYLTYTHPLGQINPFIGAGFVNTIWLSPTVTTSYYKSIYYERFDAENNQFMKNALNRYQTSALGEFGLEYKSLRKISYFACAFFEVGSNITKPNLVKSSTMTIGAVFGVKYCLNP